MSSLSMIAALIFCSGIKELAAASLALSAVDCLDLLSRV